MILWTTYVADNTAIVTKVWWKSIMGSLLPAFWLSLKGERTVLRTRLPVIQQFSAVDNNASRRDSSLPTPNHHGWSPNPGDINFPDEVVSGKMVLSRRAIRPLSRLPTHSAPNTPSLEFATLSLPAPRGADRSTASGGIENKQVGCSDKEL